MAGIKRQLIHGAIYLAIAKYSGIFVNIIVLGVLARILSPSDFAVIAIISVFSNFFVLFSDFGIAAAIIQKQDLTQSDLNSIFSYCCYFGVIISVGFCLCSYGISVFYDNAHLGILARYLTIQVLFSSLNIVPNALVLKKKEFAYIAIRTFIINVICGTAAIIGAVYGLGIYSLIINPIFSSILIFLFNYLKIRPLNFIPNPKYSSLGKVLGYSIFNLGYNIINYFSRNIDKLIVGKCLSLNLLGYYEKSYSLMMMPVQNVISVVNPVIHPILSKYQDDEKRVFKYFINISKLFAWIGFPISVLIYSFSDLIILIILGPDWKEAVPVFKILSLSIGFQLCYALQGPFFLIRNKPSVMLYCGIFTFISNIASLIIGIMFYGNLEMIGVLIDISYLLSFIITMFFLIKTSFCKESFLSFIKIISAPILISFLYLIVSNYNLLGGEEIIFLISKYFLALFLIVYSSLKIVKLFKQAKS